MEEIILKITAQHHGKTVKQILDGHLKLSSRLISRLKVPGGITVNGKNVTVRAILYENDILKISPPARRSENVIPVNIPIDILYEDDDILAVNKPQDMPVHPSLHNYRNTLGNAVMYHYGNPDMVYRAVTRLDRDTTGIVLIAKTQRAAAVLSKQLIAGKIIKTYYCITENIPEPQCGEINAPIKRERESIIKRCVSPEGQNALTRYEVLIAVQGCCLIKVQPVTGRTHQIRVHLSHIGCPLKNDFLYGSQNDDAPFKLHCGSLEFYHPASGERMIITCRAEFM